MIDSEIDDELFTRPLPAAMTLEHSFNGLTALRERGRYFLGGLRLGGGGIVFGRSVDVEFTCPLKPENL